MIYDIIFEVFSFRLNIKQGGTFPLSPPLSFSSSYLAYAQDLLTRLIIKFHMYYPCVLDSQKDNLP